MGPIIEPANGKLLNALTTLGEGETWAVEPKKLDNTGRLWSPGVRHGVRSVLCEGGPTLNSHLLAAGLVDELFLSLSPRLVGGTEEGTA